MNIKEIIFEFKRYYKETVKERPCYLFSDFVNDFMFENKYYGEDIYNILMNVKIDEQQ